MNEQDALLSVFGRVDDDRVFGDMIDVWEGRGAGDNDGRGYTVGWFLTEKEATEAVKTAGGWGVPGSVIRA